MTPLTDSERFRTATGDGSVVEGSKEADPTDRVPDPLVFSPGRLGGVVLSPGIAGRREVFFAIDVREDFARLGGHSTAVITQ